MPHEHLDIRHNSLVLNYKSTKFTFSLASYTYEFHIINLLSECYSFEFDCVGWKSTPNTKKEKSQTLQISRYVVP